MSYIGREPQIGNFQMCDAISVVNNQASYTMQVGGVAVIPGGNFNVICSLNGVIQKSGTSFVTSSSTITFSQNLVTGDVIDFILILGSVLDLGVPSDGTVTTGKIVDANVTTAKIADNAVTTAKLASGLALGKIGQVVQGTLTSTFTNTSQTYADIGLSAAITPVATSSKVLVQAMIPMQVEGGSEADARVKVLRGSTTIHESGGQNFALYGAGVSAHDFRWVNNFIQLDSPSTAGSAVTYKFQYRKGNTSSTTRASFQNTPSFIVLMEVLA